MDRAALLAAARCSFARGEPACASPFSNPTDEVREEEDDRDLRPQRMQDMVGQRDVYARLQIAVDAARKRGEPLGHILFDGPPGLGKTTFATCIPRDLGVSLQIASGAVLQAPKDVIPYLTNAEEGSVLFIDEIHRLAKSVEEFLYPAMEDFRIDLTLGEGMNARTINMALRPFTLIGATTRAGLLSAPLRDRFQMREHLDFYTVDELAEIVRRNAAKLQMAITDDAALEIARRSRSTPRLANNRLRWVRDYVTSKADGRVTLELARQALEMQQIDMLGPRRPGPQIPGDDHPRVSRRAGRGRGGRPHHECGPRHVGRRNRALSAADRPGGANSARPQSDGRGLRTSWPAGRRRRRCPPTLCPSVGCFLERLGRRAGRMRPNRGLRTATNCLPPAARRG